MNDYYVTISFCVGYNIQAVNFERAEDIAKEQFIKDNPNLANEDLEIEAYFEGDID